ncbi:MAG: type II secretion system protein GspN [Deltaproteobacteria bacterium]|nr:type II secretion system protein GspN [Deltaproteobacteria bacterium]
MRNVLSKVAIWVGYPLFAAASFLTFVYVTFPYDAVKGLIEDYAAVSGDVEVRIGDLGPSPLFGVTAREVSVRLTPPAPPPPPPMLGTATEGQPAPEPPAKPKPVRIVLEEVTVSAGLLALLSGGTDISFSVLGMGGKLSGRYTMEKKRGWTLEAEAKELDLGALPSVSAAIGLPVQGKLSAKVDLQVPLHRLANASGSIELEGEGLSIGDGKAKLKVPGDPMLAMGVTLPRVNLGKLGGQLKIEKGELTLDGFASQSPDLELALEGNVSLREPLAYSTVSAYLRIKVNPELKRKDTKFEILENSLQAGKRSDGYYGMRLFGILKRLDRQFSPLGPGGRGGGTGGGGAMPRMRYPGAGLR